MKQALIALGASAATMLVLDGIWLSTMAKRLYRPRLGDLVAENFHLAPAAAFYVTYVAGTYFLAVQPALAEGRVDLAAIRGAALGFVAYATYDLTNQATLRHWSTTVTVADMAWGTVLTAITAGVGAWAAKAFG
jgi:uncharacterized membrane protein